MKNNLPEVIYEHEHEQTKDSDFRLERLFDFLLNEPEELKGGD